MRSGIICAAICLSMAAFGQATQTTVTEYRTITTTFYDRDSGDAKPTNIHDHDNGGLTDTTDPAPEPTEEDESTSPTDDEPRDPESPDDDVRPPQYDNSRDTESPDDDVRPPPNGEQRGPEPPDDDVRPPQYDNSRDPESPEDDVRPPPNGEQRGPEPPHDDVRPPPNGKPRGPEPPHDDVRPPPPPPPFNNVDDKSITPEPFKGGIYPPQELPKNGKSQSLIHTATPPFNNKIKPTSASASAFGAISNVATDFTFSPITLAPESSQSIRPTTLHELTASNDATEVSYSTENLAVGSQYTLSFATVASMTMMCVLASTLVQL